MSDISVYMGLRFVPNFPSFYGFTWWVLERAQGSLQRPYGGLLGRIPWDDILGGFAEVSHTSCACWLLFGEKLPNNVSYPEILSILDLCE